MNSNTSKTSCKRGFTLIELLVVVLIIGILAAVAVPQYQKAVEKSHAAEAITQLRALAEAEKVYFLANGEYTNDWDKLDISIDKTREHPNVTERHQKNWYFALTNITGEYPVLWARREDRSFQQGAWYLVYDMNTDKIYCEAYAVDTESVRACSAFGVVADGCPWGEGDSYGNYKCALVP